MWAGQYRHLRGDSRHEGLEDLPLARGGALLRQGLKARGQAVQAVVPQQRDAEAVGHQQHSAQRLQAGLALLPGLDDALGHPPLQAGVSRSQ